MFQLRKKMYTWLERSVLATGALGVNGASLPAGPPRMVFVCTGNICRSPYAEFVARSMGMTAMSAGIDTQNGLPANDTAMAEASRRGVDMTSHRTTRWQDVDLSPGDLIVAMQLHHARATLQRARQHACHVVMLNAFLRPDFAVLWDPYGKPQHVFAESFDLIESGLQRLIARLRSTPVAVA